MAYFGRKVMVAPDPPDPPESLDIWAKITEEIKKVAPEVKAKPKPKPKPKPKTAAVNAKTAAVKAKPKPKPKPIPPGDSKYSDLIRPAKAKHLAEYGPQIKWVVEENTDDEFGFETWKDAYKYLKRVGTIK